jgi:putative oxidoreductase
MQPISGALPQCYREVVVVLSHYCDNITSYQIAASADAAIPTFIPDMAIQPCSHILLCRTMETTPQHSSSFRILVAPIAMQSGIFLLRIWLGAMMITHGQGKVFGDMVKFISGVEKLGLPAAGFFGWAAALSEFCGGILLALGLGTRFAAIVVMITMAVAAFMKHAPDAFNVKELALTYLVVSAVIFIIGPGRFSLDSMIAGRRSTR